MTTDLNRLAKSLALSAPDETLAARLEQEREKIEEALLKVGEYVLSDDNGRIYVITTAKDGEGLDMEQVEHVEADPHVPTLADSI